MMPKVDNSPRFVRSVVEPELRWLSRRDHPLRVPSFLILGAALFLAGTGLWSFNRVTIFIGIVAMASFGIMMIRIADAWKGAVPLWLFFDDTTV